MLSFLRCTCAELLKLKRTPALMVVLVAPYLMALLTLLILYFHSERILPSPQVDSWTYLAQTSFSTWCVVFLPLFTGVVSALAAAIEHRSGGFRHLFTLPLGRKSMFLAKQATGLLLIAASLGFQIVGLLIAGFLLKWLRPGLGFEDPIPWAFFLRLLVITAAAAGFLCGAQTWIALVTRTVAAPIAAGIVATVAILPLRAFDREALVFIPWAYPGEAVYALSHGADAHSWAAVGIVCGFAFAIFSAWSFSHRDVT